MKFARGLGFEGFRSPKVSKTRRNLQIPEGLSPIGERFPIDLRLGRALGERLQIIDDLFNNINSTDVIEDDGKRVACGAIGR